MTENNYIYAPDTAVSDGFRCRVPMKGTRQVFVINGGVQGTGKRLSISVPDNGKLDETLQIISVRTPEQAGRIAFGNSIHFGKSSSGALILCSHTFSEDPFVTEETSEISLGEGASASIVLMQNEHNKATHNTEFNISLGEGATLNMVFMILHGGSIGNNINIALNGRHAWCDISGLYLVDGSQKVDNRVMLLHNVPECKSTQLFKGIIDDSGKAVFKGLIKVLRDAQKTEAYQENHHLILTDEAKGLSEPQLEIYADDVRCSHGATNGRLDSDALFYMRSRGIPEKEAGLLQQLAFTSGVLEKIHAPELRERMAAMVEQRLRGEFTDCKGCSRNCC